ncbi:MAG: hypothetical protein Q8N53_14525 [Longimicrobiales bacterium]|nr:hypothetical protein [Longimicrobiales bacterium]
MTDPEAGRHEGGDPLHREATFVEDLELPVLGVPTRFLTSHPELSRAVRDTFGAWEILRSRPELLAPAHVRVRLMLHEAGGDGPGAEVRYRMPEPDRVIVTTPGSVGIADMGRGEVTAYVTAELVADEAHFRHAFLSALTLAAVTVHDRIPIHAAAVTRGDHALLLHGPSGVGKSSLVLAAAQQGVGVLSEDVVYAQLRDGPRIWGMPGAVHVTPDALRFFPGITPLRQVVRTGGVRKLAVAPDPRAVDPPLFAHKVGTCVLERSEGPPVLKPGSVDEVRALLSGAQESGFDLYAAAAGRAAAFVGAMGVWHVRIGSDPHAAASLLADLLGRMSDGHG